MSLDLEKYALNSYPKLDGMCASDPESVIVRLKRIPIILGGRVTADTSSHRANPINVHHGGIATRERAQGKVSRCWIKRCNAVIIVYKFVVVSKADRIHEVRREAVSFLHNGDLPIRLSIKLDVTK